MWSYEGDAGTRNIISSGALGSEMFNALAEITPVGPMAVYRRPDHDITCSRRMVVNQFILGRS